MEVRFFRDLALKHPGARICVTGGGPTLAAEVAEARADVWISANEHGAKLRKVDYVLAMDDKHTDTRKSMQEHLRQFTDAPIIGPWPWCEYVLNDWPKCPRKMLSGAVGAWAAWAMGAHPVILAGMDCYGGRNDYVEQFQAMREIVGAVKVIGGPLGRLWTRKQAFGPWDQQERIQEAFKAPAGEIRIRVLKPANVRGHPWPKGAEMLVLKHEVDRLLRHRMVKEIAC